MAAPARPFQVLTGDDGPPETEQSIGEVHGGQLRFAKRFAHTYRDQLMFVHGLGWYGWTATHWQADTDGAPSRAVADLLRDAWAELGTLDSDQRKQLVRDIGKCESAMAAHGCMTLAGSCPASPRPWTASMPTLSCSTAATGRWIWPPVSYGHTILPTGSPGALAPTSTRTPRRPLGCVPRRRATRPRRPLVPPARSRHGHARPDRGARASGVDWDRRQRQRGVYETVLAAFGDYGIVVDPKIVMASKNALHGTHYLDLMGRNWSSRARPPKVAAWTPRS